MRCLRGASFGTLGELLQKSRLLLHTSGTVRRPWAAMRRLALVVPLVLV